VDRLDFELAIGSGDGTDFPVNVRSADAGEARGRFRLPFDPAERTTQLQQLEIALLSNTPGRRRMSTGESTVRGFGQSLFDALFIGEIRAAYDVARHEAIRQEAGLSIKLRFESAPLAALPWEFLYDARAGEYLCLSRTTPVVRYLEIAEPLRPLAVTTPLRILGVVASPSDLPSLDVANERGRLERALADLVARHLVELVWLEHPTWRELQRTLRTGPWHLFHFVGHGGFDAAAGEGVIVLLDDDGRADRVQAVNLGRLLGDHFPLRLAVLNACEGARGDDLDVFSSAAATLVRRGTPAVLAMQYEITDRAAIELAQAFYEAVADGLPVDSAITEARKAVCLAIPDTLEWGVPVLYTHAPDGVLFHIADTAPAPTPASLSPPPPTSVAPTREVADPATGEAEGSPGSAGTPAPATDAALESTAPPARGEPPPDRPRVEVAPSDRTGPSNHRRTIVLTAIAVAAVLLVGAVAFALLSRSSGSEQLGDQPVARHVATGGAKVAVAHDELSIALPADTDDRRGGVVLSCRPTGDFDLAASFRLEQWNTANQARLGLVSGGVAMVRLNDPGQGGGYAVVQGSFVRRVATDDVTGVLRLTRQGDIYTGSVVLGGSNQALSSRRGPTGAVPLELVAWEDDGVHEAVAATLTDVKLNAGACA
jgi:hypothetical protein